MLNKKSFPNEQKINQTTAMNIGFIKCALSRNPCTPHKPVACFNIHIIYGIM